MIKYANTCFFFFSSRRRHTRLQGDWSSDVCSSDLPFSCKPEWRLDMSRPSAEPRILIADDHELVRRGIRTVLEERREWVVCGEAATAGDCIEKAKKFRPDILLLDVTLPDMDAAGAISAIMRVCPAVKIVALTMHDSGEEAARALAAGAIGLVLKSDAANDLV